MPIYKRLCRRWWSWYGPGAMDLLLYFSLEVLNTRQKLQNRKDWGIQPGPLSQLGSFHLIVHGEMKLLYPMLKDMKKTKQTKKPMNTSPQHPLPEQRQMSTTQTTPHTAPPCNCLLQEQSFYKKGLRLRSSPVRPPSPLALSSLGYLTAPKDILLLDPISTQAPFVRKWEKIIMCVAQKKTHTYTRSIYLETYIPKLKQSKWEFTSVWIQTSIYVDSNPCAPEHTH